MARAARVVLGSIRVLSAVVLILGVLAVAAVFAALRTAPGQRIAVDLAIERVRERLAGDLRVGSVAASADLSGSIGLRNVEVTDPHGRPVIRVDSLRVRYSLLGLLRGRYAIAQADVWGADVTLVRHPDGRVNMATILADASDDGGRHAGADSLVAPGRDDWRLLIRDARLHDARLRIDVAAEGKPLLVTALDARIPEVVLGGPTGDHVEIASGSMLLERHGRRIRVTDVEGLVRHGDRLVTADLDLVATEASRGTGTVQVRWGDGVSTRIDADLAQLDLSDLEWLETRLPDGWAAGRVAVDLGPERRRVEWADLQVQSSAGQVNGDGALDLTGTPAARGVRLRVEDLDLTVLEPWLGERVHGVATGTVSADGTRRGARVEGDVTLVHRDDPSIRSDLRFAGGVRTEPAPEVTDLLVESPRLDYRLLNAYLPAVKLRGAGPLRVLADGRPADSLWLDGEVEYALGGQPSVLRWAGSVRRGDDEPRVDGTVQVDGLQLAALAPYAPRAGLRGTASGRIRLRGALDRLTVETDLSTSGGPLAVSMEVNALDPGAGLRVSGPLEGLEPARLSSRVPDETVLRGRVEIATDGFDPASVRARGSLTLSSGSRLGRMEVGPLRAAGSVTGGVLAFDTLVAQTALGELEGVGSLALTEEAAPEGRMELDARIESFEEFARFLRGDSLVLVPDETDPLAVEQTEFEGTVQGRLTVHGWVRALSLDGTLEGSDLLLGPVTADAATVQISAQNLPGGTATARLVATQTTAWDRSFQRLEADVTAEGARGDLDVLLVRDETDDLRARMVVRRDSARTQVFVDRLTVQSEGDRWNLGGPASIVFAEEGITVRDFQFVRPGQARFRLRVDGEIPREGSARLSIDAQRMNVARLARLLQIDEEAAGVFDLSLLATGDVANPDVTLSVSGGAVGFRSARVDAFQANFQVADGVLDAAVEGRLDQRRILEARGSAPFELSLYPFRVSLPDDGPLDIDVVADDLPLGLALGFSPSFESIEGVVDGRIHFGGTAGDLEPGGALELRGGSAALPGLGIHLREGRGQVALMQDGTASITLSVRDEGLASVSGTVDLSQLRNPRFDLIASATRFRAVDRRDVSGRVSGEVELTGSYEAPVVTGTLLTDGGVLYVEEFEAQSLRLDLTDPMLMQFLNDDDSIVPVLEAQNPFLRNLSAVVDLRLDRDTWLRSEAMNVELGGDLQIIYDRQQGELSMLGALTAVRGTYRVAGRQFNVRDGDIEFFGTPGVNPTLDIRAATRLRNADQPLDITAEVTGTLLQPNVRLTSDEAGLSQEDLLSYIVFGRPAYGLTEGESVAFQSAFGGLAGYGRGVVTQTVTSAVSGFLPFDYFSVSNGQNITGDAISTGFLDAQVEIGQYVTQDLFVSFLLDTGRRDNQGIFSGVRAELALGDQWSLEGFIEDQFARQRSTTFNRAFELNQVRGVFLFRDWVR